MANNRVQVKRTSTSGRTPNTTGSYATNSQYISAGELALNMADGILYTSNGSAVIEIGANNVNQRITNSISIDNNKSLRFQTVNTSAYVGLRQQSDDNFVLYTTNTAYGERAVWSIFANSVTSNVSFSVPAHFNANVGIATGAAIYANGGPGTSGQVLSSNGSAVYWATPGAASVNVSAQYTWTNTHTFNSNTTVGNATFANTFLNSYTGISNPQSLTAGVLQTSATLNTLLVGPYTISSGNSLVITTGSRVVII